MESFCMYQSWSGSLFRPRAWKFSLTFIIQKDSLKVNYFLADEEI